MPNSKYTVEQREYLWDVRRVSALTPSVIHNNWEELITGTPPTYWGVTELLKVIDRWQGSQKTYLEWFFNGKRLRYTNEEDDWLSDHVHLRGDMGRLAEAWYDRFGYDRPITALKSKICTKNVPLAVPSRRNRYEDDFNETFLKGISPDIYLKPGQKYNGYNGTHIYICYKEGHEFEKFNAAGGSGCAMCASNHVGGMPRGPEPALVYLLIFIEWNKCKIGYAGIGNSSSPEEAIHRTSKGRGYPYPYIIGAYDLSTKTDAGILEDRLLTDTIKNKAFVESQEFAGHTEFRTWETIKQLKEAKVFKTWL